MMSMPLPLPRRCAHGYSVRALTIVRKLNVWRAVFVIRVRTDAERGGLLRSAPRGIAMDRSPGAARSADPHAPRSMERHIPALAPSAVPSRRLLRGDFLG